MRQNRFLIVLCTYVAVCFGFTSCTYDYFEDETNYVVFVPEILDGTIRDCRVMVYTDAGLLVKARQASYPWDDDPRIAAGRFSFHLPPGAYKVYCYTNTDSLLFTTSRELGQAAFSLKESSSGAPAYSQPSDLFFQQFFPSIVHTGYLQEDTLKAERYVGRITLRFKHFPADVSQIDRVKLVAEGISTRQYLKEDTLTTRFTPSDVMHHLATLPNQPDPSRLEIEHRYFPSILGEAMRLHFTFLNASGGVVTHLPVEVTDRITATPLRLLHGKRLIIEIDSYTVVKISVVGWDEDIQSGNTDME